MTITEVAKDQFVDGGNPGVGKAIVIGSVAGIVFSFTGVGGACLAAGWEWTTALGLGAFASIWSGLGFGFMFGGIVYVTKLERLQEAERMAARSSASAEARTAGSPADRQGAMASRTPGSATLA